MRTIKVTGKGQIRVHPDMTRIVITLEGLYKDYEKTLRKSSEQTEALRELLLPFGFDRKDLKTLNFTVDTEYESYKVQDTYRQRLVGYKYSHVLKVEFDSDNKRLGRILFALANCDLHPEFRIVYTVKDPEAVKNDLLGKAVRDATEKAKVLAGAAGVPLREIQSIDYSWGEMRFEVEPMSKCLPMEAPRGSAGGSYDMNIEPDDIDVQDTVTLVWEIG